MFFTSAIRYILRVTAGHPAESDLPSTSDSAQPEPTPADDALQRLSEGMLCLERLDAERTRRDDPLFGRSTEDRIIWGELLELEIQDIEAEVNRIFGPPGSRSGE